MSRQNKIPRLDFARDCGIDNRNLTIIAKRGKLVITSSRCDKCVDRRKPCTGCKDQEHIDLGYTTPDGVEINREFYDRYTKEPEPLLPPPPKQPVGRPKTPEAEVERRRIERTSSVNPIERKVESRTSAAETRTGVETVEVSESSSEALLTKVKKFRDIQEKEVSIRLKELQEKQIKGKTLPIAIAEEMIVIMAESMKRSYSDANENLVTIIADRVGAQAHDIAFMRKKSKDAINKAIDDSVDLAKAKVKSMISEVKEND